jgi:hypothetical protein
MADPDCRFLAVAQHGLASGTFNQQHERVRLP